jgi:hypothetical protein
MVNLLKLLVLLVWGFLFFGATYLLASYIQPEILSVIGNHPLLAWVGALIVSFVALSIAVKLFCLIVAVFLFVIGGILLALNI